MGVGGKYHEKLLGPAHIVKCWPASSVFWKSSGNPVKLLMVSSAGIAVDRCIVAYNIPPLFEVFVCKK